MPSRQELANAIRALSIDAVEQAKSGHPGAPMGMAQMAEALWRGPLCHNPANPGWLNRDRFVLSNGHASAMLYALLHLCGYALSMDDLRSFRQLGSITPGHPEISTPGVDAATGPLGQGLATAVGMALAERMLAEEFNRPDLDIMDHHTWVFLGDGCLMEGISQEACSLAGTLGLGKLIALYDDNQISIDGIVSGWFSDDTAARFEACGWHVVRHVDGNDPHDLDAAMQEAMAHSQRPSLICCRTVIGYGSPAKAGTASAHGSPLGPEEALAAKKALGWNYPAFTVPKVIYDKWNQQIRGAALEQAWQDTFAKYSQQYPELAAEFNRRMRGELPANWHSIAEEVLHNFSQGQKDVATRVAGKNVLDVLAPYLPELVGGSADLTGSVGVWHKQSEAVKPGTYKGNFIHYGVREFLMGAMMNGMALHGGFLPYGGTFLVFSDYAKGAIRLSALMQKKVVWVLTHDSIGVGEDGPTHQPVEHTPSLRLIPGVDVWRPCDSMESAVSWLAAVENQGPTCLIMSRQNLPTQQHPQAQWKDIARGAYVLKQCQGKPQAILLATGSEVGLVMDAAIILEQSGVAVNVVSMPCCEAFDRQDFEYKNSILPPDVRCRIAVEAAASQGWWKYVGLDGQVLGMDSFGESAPAPKLYQHFGITVENIVQKIEKLIRSA